MSQGQIAKYIHLLLPILRWQAKAVTSITQVPVAAVTSVFTVDPTCADAHDGDLDNEWLAPTDAAGDWLELIISQNLEILTVYMLQNGYSSAAPNVEIWMGWAPYDVTTYTDDFELCYSGASEGAISCDGPADAGFRIAIRGAAALEAMHFGEVLVYDQANIKVASVALTGMTTADDTSKLHGTTDGTKLCPTFSIPSMIAGPLSIKFTLDFRASVYGFIVHVDNSNKVDRVGFTMIHHDGGTTACPTEIAFSPDTSAVEKVECEAFDVTEVEMTITTSQVMSFQGICKVIVIGDRCPVIATEIDRVEFTALTLYYDLLRDTMKGLDAPVVYTKPWVDNCSRPTWTVYNAADDTDITTLDPEVFKLDASQNFRTTVPLSDIAQRHKWHGHIDLYYEGVVGGLNPIAIPREHFDMNLDDPCRAAAINSKVITFPDIDMAQMTGSETTSISVLPFTDSVDDYGQTLVGYYEGICFEKVVTLVDAPDFVSITPDAIDPIKEALTITFDRTKTTAEDIDTMPTIEYKVTLKEYEGIADDIEGQFTILITCTQTVTLDTPINPINVYDLACGVTMLIPHPVVTVLPTWCYYVKDFEVLDTNTGSAEIPFLGVQRSAVGIYTTDRSLIGTYQMSITAVVDNGDRVATHSFSVELIDTCPEASIVEQYTFPEFYEVVLPTSNTFPVSFDGNTDSVSDGYGNGNNCGAISYELLDGKNQAPPSFLSVTHQKSDNIILLELDLSQVKPGTYNFKLVSRLDNYINSVAAIEQDFVIVVTEGGSWTPPVKVKPREPQKPPVIEESDDEDEDAKVGNETEESSADDNLASTCGEFCAVLDKEIKELSDQELFAKIPLDLRVNYYGSKKTEQLVFAQRNFLKSKVLNDEEPADARIKMNSAGQMDILFTKQVEVTQSSISQLVRQRRNDRQRILGDSSRDQQVQVIAIRSREDEDGDQDEIMEPLMGKWEINSLDEDKLQLKFYFDKPLEVSAGDAKDIVYVQLELEDFDARDGSQFLPSVVKQMQLPAQMKLEDVPSTDTSKGAFKESIKAASFSDFLLKILLSGSLGKLWAMFNELAIVEHMKLFNLRIPGSWNYFTLVMENLTSFNFFDIGSFIDGLMYIPEQAPFSLSFLSAGFMTTLFIKNSHIGILFYLLQSILIVPWLILTKFKGRCPTKARKLQNYLFWNGSIRLFITQYLNFALFSMLNIHQMSGGQQKDTDFSSTITSNWLCTFYFIHCFVVPVLVTAYYYKNRNKLQDKDFLNRVGTFIEGANTAKISNLKTAIMIQMAFFTRSLVLSISVVVLHFFTWGQIACNVAITTAIMIWISHTRPYESALDNKLQTYNQMITLQILTIMMCYSDFVPNPSTRNNLGFTQIALVGVQVLPSLVLMVIGSVKSVKMLCKKVFGLFLRRRMQNQGHRAAADDSQADSSSSNQQQHIEVIVQKLQVVQEVHQDDECDNFSFSNDVNKSMEAKSAQEKASESDKKREFYCINSSKMVDQNNPKQKTSSQFLIIGDEVTEREDTQRVMMQPGSGDRDLHDNENSLIVDNQSLNNEEVTRIVNMDVDEIEQEVAQSFKSKRPGDVQTQQSLNQKMEKPQQQVVDIFEGPEIEPNVVFGEKVLTQGTEQPQNDLKNAKARKKKKKKKKNHTLQKIQSEISLSPSRVD